jgi:hypothetical protein
MRKIDLGLEFFRSRTRRPRPRSGTWLTMLRVVLPDALRLIHFNGAGVRFLFRDSNLQQQIKNHFAFDLKLSRQVVNSNLLLHSALLPP